MESPWNESPFAAAPEAESEWGSPFGQAESWAEEGEGYSFEHEGGWGGESEWGSPFTTTEMESVPWQQSEVRVLDFPATCDADVRWKNEPWPYGANNERKSVQGDVSARGVARAEIKRLFLSNFDVDRYHMKPAHRTAIAALVKELKDGIASGKYTAETIWVSAYGATSTTASDLHNLALSRHRAFNTLHTVRCEFQRQGIKNETLYGLFPVGEEESREIDGPGPSEVDRARRVILQVFVQLPAPKACPTCPTCPSCPQCPEHPTVGTPQLCVSIPQIAPRKTFGIPPDIIPLGPLVPGLRMPIAIVRNGRATVRVEDRASRRAGTYAFSGWGLEVSLPAGRTVVDLRADLRASLEVLAGAAASLSAKLRAGPLGIALRIDASAFAQLVVRLCAQLRARIEIDLGRPNIPELNACKVLPGRAAPGGFAFDALAGSALLVVPGRRWGPALVSFSGSRAASTGLGGALIQVPADKSTVKTLLALGGEVRLQNVSGGASREAEAAWELPLAEGELYDYGAESEDPFGGEVEFEAPYAEALPSYEEFAAELLQFA